MPPQLAASTEASPLPTPKPVATNWSDLLLQAAANAAPGASPEVTTAVAKASATPDDAVDNAQAAAQYQTAAQKAQSLSQQSEANQRSYYGSLPKSQQQQLTSAGYKPPSSGGGGLFSDISGAFHDVTGAVKPVLSDALNAMGSPLRAVQHAYRAGEVVAAGQGGTAGPIWGGTSEGGSAGNSLSALVSIKDWAKAWNETSSGERYIMPAVERAVAKQYGNDTYQLALKLATGTTAQQIINAAPQAQQQALQTKLNNDPALSAATQALNAGHLSFGRSLVGEHFLVEHSTLGKLISGGADATFDWFGDPINVGTKFAQTAKAARYLVTSGADVDHLYKTSSAVQRAFADIADHVANGNSDQLLERYPKLQPLVRPLIQAQADTADKVNEFFKTEANTIKLISSNPIEAPGLEQGGGIVPHLTYGGQARLAVKGALRDSIDWLADTPARIEGVEPGDVIKTALNPTGLSPIVRLETTVGRMARRFITLVPTATAPAFNPRSDQALGQLRDIASMFLPRARVNVLLNEFAASKDIAPMRNIYMNLMKEMGQAAGMDSTKEGWESYMSQFSSSAGAGITDTRAYLGGGLDHVFVDGEQRAVGVFEQHMNDEMWAVPDFKILYAQAKKVGMLRSVVGRINSPFVDKFMGGWRRATLTRIGFGLRIAADEGLIGLMRHGPAAYARSLVAAEALKMVGRVDPAALEDLRHGDMYYRWMGHLPQDTLDDLHASEDSEKLIVERSADAYRRAFTNVVGALGGAKFREHMASLVHYGVFNPGGAFSRNIAAVEQAQAGYGVAGDLAGKTHQFQMDGKVVNAELHGTGAYKDYRPADENYINMWAKNLQEIGNSAWARESLDARTLDPVERLNRVADKLEADPLWHGSSIRSTLNRAGQMVKTGEITTRQAALDHAQVINDGVDSLIQSPDGTEIPDLVDRLQDKGRIHPSVLENVDYDTRPEAVKGPETVWVVPSEASIGKMLNKSSDWLFSHVIGPQIDFLVRKPLMWHNYAVSREAYSGMADGWAEMMSREEADLQLHKVALDRAFALTTPYIHNPELKSQFSSITRNLAPFWFAQEQFYKRWARSFAFAPWTVRQLQLTNQGIQHSGLTHTDPETGEEYFVYPASGAVQDVLTHALGALGVKATLPIAGALTGQVNEITPGLERLGLPNVGPLVSIPMDGLKRIDPHLTGLTNTVNGSADANEAWYQTVLPTTMDRVLDVADPTAFDKSQYASAQMQAIQYLEASGHGIGTVATTNLGQTQAVGDPASAMANMKNLTPGDYVTDAASQEWVYQPDGTWKQNSATAMQTYLARVQNWTRTLLGTRLLFGFSVPASPELQFNPGNLHDELVQDMNNLPLDQALTAFIAANPDANAYTVFQTTTQGGAPLPATTAAMSWIDSNPQFMSAHPLAALYFLPTKDTQGKFSDDAYQTQLAEQLRQRKDPTDFWQQVVYDQAATTYYNAEDQKNAYLTSPPAGYSKAQIDSAWTQWSQNFMQANPIFAAQDQASDGPYQRASIMADVGAALRDPNLHPTTTSADIKTLYNAYVTWQTATQPNSNPDAPSASSEQVTTDDLAFANWAQAFTAAHPDTASLYNKAIRPDLSSVLTNAASGNTTTPTSSTAASSLAGSEAASGTLGAENTGS